MSELASSLATIFDDTLTGSMVAGTSMDVAPYSDVALECLYTPGAAGGYPLLAVTLSHGDSSAEDCTVQVVSSSSTAGDTTTQTLSNAAYRLAASAGTDQVGFTLPVHCDGWTRMTVYASDPSGTSPLGDLRIRARGVLR